VKPQVGLRIILRDALTVLVKQAEIVHRGCISLFGLLAKPRRCVGFLLRYLFPELPSFHQWRTRPNADQEGHCGHTGQSTEMPSRHAGSLLLVDTGVICLYYTASVLIFYLALYCVSMKASRSMTRTPSFVPGGKIDFCFAGREDRGSSSNALAKAASRLSLNTVAPCWSVT